MATPPAPAADPAAAAAASGFSNSDLSLSFDAQASSAAAALSAALVEAADDDANPDADAAGDLDALLATLMQREGGSGADGEAADEDEDEGTFFQINAAASFAAVVVPEEQLTELGLEVLDVSRAAETIEALTPLELAQVALLLQQFISTPAAKANAEFAVAAAAAPSSAAAGSAGAGTPLFHVSRAGPLTQRWVRLQERQLMHGLQALGVGLNRESLPAAAGSAASSATSASASAAASSPATPSSPALPVYSLLFKGSKLTSSSTLASLRHDAYALLALEDVVQPNLFVKQLLGEVVRTVIATLCADDEDAGAEDEEEEKKTGDAPAVPGHAAIATPSRAATLRSQLSHAHVVPSRDSSLGSPFAFDLASGALTCPSFDAAAFSDPAQEDALRKMLGLRSAQEMRAAGASDTVQQGELLAALLPYCIVEVCRAVWSAVLSAPPDAAASPSSAGERFARALLALLCSADLPASSSSSPLSSLWSAEDAAVLEQSPSECFVALVGAATERRWEQQQQQQQQSKQQQHQQTTSGEDATAAASAGTAELGELVAALRRLVPAEDDLEAHQEALRTFAGL